MGDLAAWIGRTTGLPPLGAGCVLYAGLVTVWGTTIYLHRILLAKSVLFALRDLRRTRLGFDAGGTQIIYSTGPGGGDDSHRSPEY